MLACVVSHCQRELFSTMGLKELAKKLAYGPKATSDSYIVWLRSKGMVIGDNCAIYAPTKTCIDVQNPWMIEMGDNVQITEGVTILTHGYDWSVFKGKYGDVLGSAGHVKIGSNVFIGMKATILKGTTIGDNVVIGANSLINKDVPSDCVVAGNPQRIICSIDEYLENDVTHSWLKHSIFISTGEATHQKVKEERCLARNFSVNSSGCSRSVAKMASTFPNTRM